MATNLSRALEEYLEAIYAIKYEENKKIVRVRDIARRLNVSMPSVTDALNRLAKLGLIEYEKREYIDLTDEGEELAKTLYEREQFLIEFLTEFLFLPREIAEKDACKIEHDLSKETMDKLIAFVKFIEECFGKIISEKFREYLEKEKC